MASIIFDGTSNQVATPADLVVFLANPLSVSSISESGGNVVITASTGFSLTITGQTLAGLAPSNFSIPNGTALFGDGLVSTAGDAAGNILTAATANNILVGLGGGDAITVTGQAGNTLIVGGSSFADAADGPDTITLTGASGKFTIFANSGDDQVLTGGTGFGGATTVNLYAGIGTDTVDFSGNTKALTGSIYGGDGPDTLTVDGGAGTNVSVFGGNGGVDTAGDTDNITVGGEGSFSVYGNGGNDLLQGTFTGATTLSAFGGLGIDIIGFDAGTNALTGSVYGGTGLDFIGVNGGVGTNVSIFGGNVGVDTADSTDQIGITGEGTFSVYGNAGDDIIQAALTGPATVTIFGGLGIDQIDVQSTDKVTGNIYGSSGTDVVQVAGGAGSNVSVFGGNSADDDTDEQDIILVTTGDGKYTVSGGLGNDEISVFGDLGAKNVASVFGDAGNDTITVDGTVGEQLGTYTLDGGTGVDTFVFAAGSAGAPSNKGFAYTINNFTAGAGGDVLDVDAIGNTQTTFDLVVGPFATLEDGTAASDGKNDTNVFQFGADTYVVVNDGTAGGFDPALDTVIKLTGVTATTLVDANIIA